MQYETSYLIFRDDDLASEYYRDLLEGDMSREHDSEFLEDYTFDYVIDGIELDLVGEAYPSGRCLDYNPDGRLFEMEALAEGRDLTRYYIRWIFEDNGEESYDAYDYSEPHDCVPVD